MSKKEEKAKEEKEEKVVAESEDGTTQEAEEKAVKPEDLQIEIEQLKGELAIAKNEQYKAYADADNLRKRLLADAENTKKYRIQSFVQEILPAIDSLELALNDKDLNDPFVKGVKLTYDSLMNALSKEGITVIEALNQPFDSNLHHAIMTEKVEGVEPNTVIQVFQKGYKLHDRLVRAALVKVSE